MYLNGYVSYKYVIHIKKDEVTVQWQFQRKKVPGQLENIEGAIINFKFLQRKHVLNVVNPSYPTEFVLIVAIIKT